MDNSNLNWNKAFEQSQNGNRLMLDDHIRIAYHQILIPVIKSKIKSTTDIQDLANEVVTKFWERFYVLEEILPENVNGYLYTMAMNKVYHHSKFNSKLRNIQINLEDVSLKAMLNSLSTDDNHKNHREKEKKIMAMESAIQRLCSQCKKIIVYSFFQKMKLKDCYKELGIPTANAASKKKIKCLNKLIAFAYQELSEINIESK